MLAVRTYWLWLIFGLTLQSSLALSKTRIEVETLANGMQLVSLEAHKVPLVTIVISVKAGALTESPDTNGLTHLWEHMFFKGNAFPGLISESGPAVTV